MVIHTFGDSHSVHGWNTIPYIKTHSVGPRLLYSIGRDGLDISNPEQNVKNGDTLVFCFGEIDCRCHIYKYVSESLSYQAIIDDMVDAYLKQIQKTISVFENIKTYIYNVVPGIQKQFLHGNPAYPFLWNPAYPHLGSDEERKQYILYINQKLKEKCKDYGFIFFDVYDKYIDENGQINFTYSYGDIHINDGRFIKEFIEQNNLVID